MNYHEDDYDVAMGLAALSDSVSSYDDPNDETFTVQSQVFILFFFIFWILPWNRDIFNNSV